MKIGISTAVNTGKDNWDRMNDLVLLGYSHIELYNKITRIRYTDVEPLSQLRKTKDLTFTFHSMVQDLFCTDKVIAEAELSCLKGEIKLASLIGCTRVIFHINQKRQLTNKEISDLVMLNNFATQQKVQLCLENNQSKGPFAGEYFPELMSKIPGLFFCVDTGHLKITTNKGYVDKKLNFIRLISKQIVELHISGNNAINDEHIYIQNCDLPLIKKVAGGRIHILDLIIETKNIDQAVMSKNVILSE